MTSREIVLGGLRLRGEARNGGAHVEIDTSDHGTYNMWVTANEFESLLAIAAVVEAAKEWNRSDKAMEHGDDPAEGEKFRIAWDALNAAVDRLTATSSKEKQT